MRRRAPPSLAVGLVAIAFLTGCGGDGGGREGAQSEPPLTKAAYEAKVQEIVASVGAEYGRLSTDPTTITANELATVQRGLRELADRLSRVSAPTEVRDLHAEYVEAMRSYADELPDLTDELREAKDPAKSIDLLLGSEPVQALLRVSRELDEKGYRFELGGS